MASLYLFCFITELIYITGFGNIYPMGQILFSLITVPIERSYSEVYWSVTSVNKMTNLTYFIILLCSTLCTIELFAVCFLLPVQRILTCLHM